MDLHERYQNVRERIRTACIKNGRQANEVCLVAVSKFHPPEAIAEIARLGQTDFGENYMQEALQKKTLFESDAGMARLNWHMIGHVQSKKANQAAGNFLLIHSLDSKKLADGLQKRLEAISGVQKILIEVNIGEEPQKNGVLPCDLTALALHILQYCPRLVLKGLMCLPPIFDAPEKARPFFASMRRLRNSLERETDLHLTELSMGMSGDFEAAISEGATIVRVGTDIFGPRPRKPQAVLQ